jgi:hypothetical protein
VCSGITGRTAVVNVPTPWLSDRAPELSLVSIPTFFNLQWDSTSLGAQDSAPLTISYPVGNPTDKLVNVRVQLRLRALPYPESNSESQLATANVAVESLPPPYYTYLVDPDDPNSMDPDACFPSDEHNALLTILGDSGGYANQGGTGACANIRASLHALSARPDFDHFVLPAAGLSGSTERYLGWPNSLPMSQFLVFTPFASIYGEGTDRGSPAFQVTATTRFQVEARVVWDEHQERRERVDIDCQWSYRNDYDFIDWTRWPDPIYCRRNVVVWWGTFCRPLDGGCPYGNPDDWWIPYVPSLEAQAIRGPDGTYGLTYDFVSVQSQALLTSP